MTTITTATMTSISTTPTTRPPFGYLSRIITQNATSVTQPRAVPLVRESVSSVRGVFERPDRRKKLRHRAAEAPPRRGGIWARAGGAGPRRRGNSLRAHLRATERDRPDRHGLLAPRPRPARRLAVDRGRETAGGYAPSPALRGPDLSRAGAGGALLRGGPRAVAPVDRVHLGGQLHAAGEPRPDLRRPRGEATLRRTLRLHFPRRHGGGARGRRPARRRGPRARRQAALRGHPGRARRPFLRGLHPLGEQAALHALDRGRHDLRRPRDLRSAPARRHPFGRGPASHDPLRLGH